MVYKCVVDSQENDGTAANVSTAMTFTWSVKDGAATPVEKLVSTPTANYE